MRSFAGFSTIELSPDGKWLACAVGGREKVAGGDKEKADSDDPGYENHEDVWLISMGSGETRNLTRGKGRNWLPKWSPAGRFLAFLSDRDGGKTQLWMWDAAHDGQKKISDTVVVTMPADQIEWLPNAQGIVVGVQLDEPPAEAKAEDKTASPNENSATSEKRGPSVHEFYSSAIRAGSKEAAKSDPFSLNIRQHGLAVIEVATGHADVVALRQNIQAFRLSPDGTSIAYTIRKRFEKPGSQQILYDLVVRELSSKKEHVAASGVRLGFDGYFIWSPDSKLLAYQPHGAAEKTHDCYVVDARGGAPRNVTNLEPPAEASSDYSLTPSWSKDGSLLYFVNEGTLWRASVKEAKASASLVARIPGHPIWFELPQEPDGALWTLNRNDSTIVAAHDDQGKQDGFYRIDLRTGEATRLLERGQCYTCGNDSAPPFVATRDGRQIVYCVEDAQHPLDLWRSDAELRNSQQLTHLNPELEAYKFGAGRLISWLSDDGEPLHGALLLPVGYEEGKRYPLVVLVYGGAHLSNGFDQFALGGGAINPQLLATRGYAVLLPDSPQHPGTAMADVAKTVLPGVNKVIEMGIADPERLGVAGHSNGGYATLALIVQTKRFKAAIDVDGMGDLFGHYGSMGKDGSAFGTSLEQGQDAMGGTPWEFRGRYIENSPFFYLDRVDTPLLVVHVAGDPVVPSFLGDQIFVSLRRLGKEVEYAKYEGDAHGPPGFVNEVDHIQRMLAWFDKYLKCLVPLVPVG